MLQSSPRAAQFSHILSFEIKGSNSKGAVLVFTIAFYKVPQIFRTKFHRFWKLHVPPKEVPLEKNSGTPRGPIVQNIEWLLSPTGASVEKVCWMKTALCPEGMIRRGACGKLNLASMTYADI